MSSMSPSTVPMTTIPFFLFSAPSVIRWHEGFLREKNKFLQIKMNESEESMTSLERMMAMISGETVDRVPVLPLVTAASRFLFKGVTYREYETNVDVIMKCQLEAQELIGYDGIQCFSGDLCVESSDFGGKTIFPLDDVAYPDPRNWIIKTPKDYKVVRKFSWDKAKRMKKQIELVRRAAEARGDTMLIGGYTIGPMGVLVRLREPSNLVRDWVYNKEELHEALDFVTDVLVEYAEKQVEAGARSFMVPTVLAQTEIMSRDMWEELDAPYQKRIMEAATKAGAFYMCHNCGHGMYLDLLVKWLKPIAIQFAYLPYDCKTENEFIEKYSNEVIPYGYVDTSLLALGSPSEVLAESKRQIEVFRKSKRGYVLGSACEYPTSAQLYNALAMVKAARTYGREMKF